MIGILQHEGSLDGGFSVCLSGDMTAEDVRETLRYAAQSSHDRQISGIEQNARDMLQNVGHDPDRPGDLKAPAESRTIATAHSVLRHIRLWRNALASGDYHETLRRASEIWMLVSRHDFFIEHEAAIRRGHAFIEGPKRPRQDHLARAIEEAFSELGLDASANTLVQLLVKLRKIEIEGGKIWISDKGREKQITLKNVHNRIAKIR